MLSVFCAGWGGSDVATYGYTIHHEGVWVRRGDGGPLTGRLSARGAVYAAVARALEGVRELGLAGRPAVVFVDDPFVYLVLRWGLALGVRAPRIRWRWRDAREMVAALGSVRVVWIPWLANAEARDLARAAHRDFARWVPQGSAAGSALPGD